MYYAKIGQPGAGLTNQIFCLVTSIIIAYTQGDKVVIVDKFYNDITKEIYTPITEIFNIKDFNIFLKQKYNVIIVDKDNINFEILEVKYGIETNNIDITEYILKNYYKDRKLFINKENCILNDIKYDPCPEIAKKVFLTYRINDYIIEEIYNENLEKNIDIDLNRECVFNLGWITPFNDNMFDTILTNILYYNDIVCNANTILKGIDMNSKINLIHLRLEEDAIKFWSEKNYMSQSDFKLFLETKYINLIENYFSKTDIIIILSHSFSNNVIDFLNENNYNYQFIHKFYDDREKNAIVDLLVSKCCNNVFIGNFNIFNLTGSTFTYYVSRCMQNKPLKIFIDLDNIDKSEYIAQYH